MEIAWNCMNMKNIQTLWDGGEEIEEGVRIFLGIRVWELMEKKLFADKRNWGKDKIMLGALVWYSEGLFHLTCRDLSFLYSLLSPTKKTCPISQLDIKTIALLSKISVINSVKILSTSVSQSFRNAELFTSMLCSGGYPPKPVYEKDIRVTLPGFGGKDL